MQPVTRILRLAGRLNDWLYRTLGPPYGVLLSVGLAIEIARHAREAIEHAGPTPPGISSPSCSTPPSCCTRQANSRNAWTAAANTARSGNAAHAGAGS